MKNIIKRNSTKMTIKTKTNSNILKDTVIELQKDEWGWHGGGYIWCISHLRDNNFVEILSQN